MKGQYIQRGISGLAVLIMAGCASTSDGPTVTASPDVATVEHRLQICRVGNVQLSAAKADEILRGATQVLRDVNSSGDVSANVVLTRNGSVRAFVEPSVINSFSDFERLRATGVNVAVVEGINDCGGYIPNIAGCAPVPGNFMAVVRLSNLEDILWAHEFGHNSGLRHRDHPEAVMHPQLGSRHRSLLQSEAERYENKPQFESATLMPQPASAADEGTPPASIDEYLGRIYVHGIPFAHVARFGPEHVERLKAVLADRAQQERWSNAVVALAAIATPEAIDRVLEFIAEGRGALSGDAYQAKRAAVMALGYTTHKRGGRVSAERRRDVLERLRAGASPEYWRQHLRWRNPANRPAARALSETALAALALSGASEAEPWFAEAAEHSGADAEITRCAIQARREYRKVRALGIREYTDLRRRHAE